MPKLLVYLIIGIVVGVVVGLAYSPIQQIMNATNTKTGVIGEVLSFDDTKVILNNAWTSSDIQCENTDPSYDFAVVNMSIINEGNRRIPIVYDAEITVEQGYIYDKDYPLYCGVLLEGSSLDAGLMTTDIVIFKIAKGTKPVELKFVLHPDPSNYDDKLTSIIKLDCGRYADGWVC